MRNFGRSCPTAGWDSTWAPARGGLRRGNQRTILWNGPMGVFEDPRFEAGTRAVAMSVAESRGFSVIGGRRGLLRRSPSSAAAEVDHISTGGGASLELSSNRATCPARSRSVAHVPPRHVGQPSPGVPKEPTACASQSSVATGRCTTTTSRRSRRCGYYRLESDDYRRWT